MAKDELNWTAIETLICQIEARQQSELLASGKRLIPHLTEDDLLQPNDFLELENHPLFRYEEGVLAGIRTIHMALRALKNDASG